MALFSFRSEILKQIRRKCKKKNGTKFKNRDFVPQFLPFRNGTKFQKCNFVPFKTGTPLAREPSGPFSRGGRDLPAPRRGICGARCDLEDCGFVGGRTIRAAETVPRRMRPSIHGENGRIRVACCAAMPPCATAIDHVPLGGLSPLGSLLPLGSIYACPGYSEERPHLFFAEVEAAPGATDFDPDENVETLLFDKETVERLVLDGTISDAKTLSAWLLAKMRICV